jgi:hypothetical protein
MGQAARLAPGDVWWVTDGSLSIHRPLETPKAPEEAILTVKQTDDGLAALVPPLLRKTNRFCAGRCE